MQNVYTATNGSAFEPPDRRYQHRSPQPRDYSALRAKGMRGPGDVEPYPSVNNLTGQEKSVTPAALTAAFAFAESSGATPTVSTSLRVEPNVGAAAES